MTNKVPEQVRCPSCHGDGADGLGYKCSKCGGKGTVPASPGSDEAIKQGCTCAVMDNNYGRGFILHGKTEFWITEGCPLHSPASKSEPASHERYICPESKRHCIFADMIRQEGWDACERFYKPMMLTKEEAEPFLEAFRDTNSIVTKCAWVKLKKQSELEVSK